MTKEQIKYLVEKAAQIDDLGTEKRTRRIADCRFVYYGLCKRFLPDYVFTLSSVGISVNRDHATVMHGLKQFDLLYEQLDWFGHYLYDLLVAKIEDEKFTERLKNQQLKKNRVCAVKKFSITK